jgi:uncharacterized protein YceH (UPF0502 family)
MTPDAITTNETLRLSQYEARILGALMEKEATTPEYYPLSLNALQNAANQRSNREPVLTLDEEDVRQALHGLEAKSLAAVARNSEGRVAKYEHLWGEYSNLTRAESALLCVLLLRGPQTPGELRNRTERIHRFDEISDVLVGLQKLIDRTPPMAAILPRQPGTKEARYAHLLSGPIDTAAFAAISLTVKSGATGIDEERITALESTVAELKSELETLRQKIERLTGS